MRQTDVLSYVCVVSQSVPITSSQTENVVNDHFNITCGWNSVSSKTQGQ